MQYDLIQAFMFREVRRGKPLWLTPSTVAYINERIDRQRRQLAGQTEATAQAPANAASESAGPSELGV